MNTKYYVAMDSVSDHELQLEPHFLAYSCSRFESVVSMKVYQISYQQFVMQAWMYTQLCMHTVQKDVYPFDSHEDYGFSLKLQMGAKVLK